MQRKYYHAEGKIENGKTFCSVCGTELGDDLMADVPCSHPTASGIIYDNIMFVVSVWNLSPSLVAYRREGSSDVNVDLEIDDSISERLNDLLYKSVEDAGGYINISGIYPVNKRLERFIGTNLRKGKIKILA